MNINNLKDIIIKKWIEVGDYYLQYIEKKISFKDVIKKSEKLDRLIAVYLKHTIKKSN